MKKYPHGLTLKAVCEAVDAYRKQEEDIPEAGMIAAFEILLEAMTAPKNGSSTPEGWKLVPIDMPDEIGEAIAIEARCCGGIALDIYESILRAIPPAPVMQPVDDLVMQIRRLVHSLKKANPDHDLVKSVTDYMQRKGYWETSDVIRAAGYPVEGE